MDEGGGVNYIKCYGVIVVYCYHVILLHCYRVVLLYCYKAVPLAIYVDQIISGYFSCYHGDRSSRKFTGCYGSR